MQARERLWLTADKQRLVGEGHRDAATLYAAIGDEVPQESADKFGLVEGRIGINAEEKRRRGGDDKSRKGGEDKDTQGKPPRPESGKEPQPEGDGSPADSGMGDPQHHTPDDLTAIKGIGAKTAKALAAAGIDSFAALAALDPAAPPEAAGISPHADWASWIAAAREMTGVAPASEV